MTAEAKKEAIEFLGRSFWIVGSFCFGWETLVLAALYRVSPEIELPLLGKCSHGEAIVLTLTFFWPILLSLHWVVHLHQSLTKERSFSVRFPGVLGDLEVPPIFARFRIVVFVLLLCWPSAAHIVLTVRGFTQLCIVYDHCGAAYPLPDHSMAKTSNEATDNLLEYCRLAQLRWLEPPKDLDGAVISGEWRWLHWRDKKAVEIDKDPRGTAATLRHWVVKPEHWPTALPIIQPWGFLVVGIGLVVSTLYLIVRALMPT